MQGDYICMLLVSFFILTWEPFWLTIMNPLFLRILIICLDVSGIFASDLSATLYIVYYVKIRMSINQHVFLRSNLYGTGAHIIKEILAPF